MDINELRIEIDAIDEKILTLLNKRANFALSIGEIKKSISQKVHDPERENTVLQTLYEKNTGPLEKKAIKKIFETIIQEHRSLELHQS